MRMRTIATGWARTLALGALVVPSALVALTTLAAPAQAAACSGDTGVIVVVDSAELGGGVVAGCAANGSGRAGTEVFRQAGVDLTFVTGQSGMVCQVGGRPAERSCADAPPVDAYWSLWTAPASGGPWTYASRGVGSLRAPENGYVAFAWHQGSGRAQPPAVTAAARTTPTPSAAPTSARPTPRPTPPRKVRPTATSNASSPAGAPASVSPSTEATTSAPPSASASATVTPSASASATPSASSSASATPSAGLPAANEITAGPDDVTPAAAEATDGLPVWIPVVVVVALVGVAGGLAARRRTR